MVNAETSLATSGVVFLLVLTFVLLKISREASTYRAQGQLLFEKPQEASIGIDSGAKEDEFEDRNFLATKVLALSSKSLLDKVEANLNNSFTGFNYDEIHHNLTIEQISETNVIEVSYISLNPQISEFVVNQVLDLYIKENLSSSRAKVSSAHQFINQQLPKVKQRVFVAESKFRLFKEKHKISDLSIAISDNAQSQARLKQELGSAEIKVKDLQAQHTRLKSLLNVNIPTVSSALNQSELSTRRQLDELENQSLIRQKLGELEQELLEKNATLGPDNPERLELQEKIAKQQSVLRAKSEELSKNLKQLVRTKQNFTSNLSLLK